MIGFKTSTSKCTRSFGPQPTVATVDIYLSSQRAAALGLGVREFAVAVVFASEVRENISACPQPNFFLLTSVSVHAHSGLLLLVLLSVL